MIIENSSSNPLDLKTRLHEIVTQNKISSLSMMSDIAGIDEEQICSILEELLDEGILEGTITPNGHRFFLSDVKISSAPTAPIRDNGYVVEEIDTKIPKLVLILGIAMMVAGYIMRGFVTMLGILEHVGAAVVMVGLVVLIIGWLMISKANPPSNIK
jgi:hypothetical protein